MVALLDPIREQEPGERSPRRSRTPAPAIIRIGADAPLPLAHRDALPEYTDYRDTGCEVSTTCLACPLARCKYDEPLPSNRALATQKRNREIAYIHRRYNAHVSVLARTYKLSRRSVFRILAAEPVPPSTFHPPPSPTK